MSIASFSSMRLFAKGGVPFVYPFVNQYIGNPSQDFEKNYLGLNAPLSDQSKLVGVMNNDPKLLKKAAQFALDTNRNMLVTNPRYQKVPSTWSERDKRTIFASSEVSSAKGHSVFTWSFEPTSRGGMASSFQAALHQIGSFPAGSSFLLPKKIYLEGIASGRSQRRFPTDIIEKYKPDIQEYNANRYSKNSSLAGEIVILGNNPVVIQDHEIFEMDGSIVQILRPVTLNNHIFYNGQALWTITNLPEFPDGNIHNYIGHGKSGLMIPVAGDFVNVHSGILVFKNLQTASSITWEKDCPPFPFDRAKALLIDKYLAERNSRIVSDRKMITLLDNMYLTDILRSKNGYTDPKCTSTGFKFLGASRALIGGECDITTIDDTEKFIEVVEQRQPESAEDFIGILETFPSSSIGTEGIYQKDGTPYTMTTFNEVFSITPEEDIFHQPLDSLLGEFIDNYIADLIKNSIEDLVDWDHIDTSTRQAIQDDIKALTESLTPFSDGSSIENILERFNTEDFQQDIYNKLKKILSESLGPHSASFYNTVMKDPLFKDLSTEFENMMKNYPFEEAVARRLFSSITAVPESGLSYLEANMRSSLIREKQNFLEDPQHKIDVQKEIAQRVKELGDVSNLKPDLARTQNEIKQAYSDLAIIQEKLLKTPDDKKLIDKRDALEKAIKEKLDQEQALEDKLAFQAELDKAQNETNSATLGDEGKDADHEVEKSAQRTFEQPARA